MARASRPPTAYLPPNRVERVLNRAFAVLVRLGLGLRHNYLLEVRGRKTGRLHSTPVNVLDWRGRRWLVAGRGRTQWVQNAEVDSAAALRKGRRRTRVRLRPVPASDRPEILSAYLDRYRRTVQRYFPVKAGSNPGAFEPLVGRYPVFEVVLPTADAAADRGRPTGS